MKAFYFKNKTPTEANFISGISYELGNKTNLTYADFDNYAHLINFAEYVSRLNIFMVCVF